MNNNKKYDTVVYIGRFQPFHNAHLATIVHAFTLAKRVIVVVGSANQPRDGNNPFTQEERIEGFIKPSVRAALGDVDLVCVSVENTIYNNMGWAMNVANLVAPHITSDSTTKLIGYSKDETSFYLKMFPQWGNPIEMPEVEVLDASTIRKMYFGPTVNLNFFANVVSTSTLLFLKGFMDTEAYHSVCREVEYIENYKKPYLTLPYPVSFNTGDAAVFKSGHVLMIRRRAEPGKGLWALPGGFLNPLTDRSIQDCAIRELYEETGIKVPEAVIRGSIVEEKIFSAISRSRRGRVITTTQCIVLPDDFLGFPRVRGMDDAEKAKWIPVHTLQRIQCFEDHYDQIQYFIGRIKD